MSEPFKISTQQVFDKFLLAYGSDEIRRFFGAREVSDEQIVSMKEHAQRRQAFREWADKAERRRGRLAARAAKRAIRRAGLEK